MIYPGSTFICWSESHCGSGVPNFQTKSVAGIKIRGAFWATTLHLQMHLFLLLLVFQTTQDKSWSRAGWAPRPSQRGARPKLGPQSPVTRAGGKVQHRSEESEEERRHKPPSRSACRRRTMRFWRMVLDLPIKTYHLGMNCTVLSRTYWTWFTEYVDWMIRWLDD